MTDRDFDRERRWRDAQSDNDWDWDYYYEYRYYPSSPYRQTDYDRNYYGRDYYANRDYFGRDYGYNYPYSNYNRGRYTGVGPRGYRRSDERIADDVNDRLMWHGDIDATDIEVDVNDGIVTLSGTVNSRREKRMAEDVAESVSGVWDVNNQLTVRNRNRYSGRNLRIGMEVVGRDGSHVGEVKEVRSNDFLVDRPVARDVYIPFTAAWVDQGQIRLNVHADEVDNQGWEMPEPVETSKKKR